MIPLSVSVWWHITSEGKTDPLQWKIENIPFDRWSQPFPRQVGRKSPMSLLPGQHSHPVQLLLGCSWTSLKSLQYYQSPKLGLLIDWQLHFTLQIVHIYFAFIFLCTQEKGRRWQSLCKLPGKNMNWSWEKIDLTTDSWTLDGGWCVDDVHRCFPQVAETVLGWKSRRSLGEMCRDMWNWQTKNPQGFSGKQSEKVGAAAWSFHYSVT